VQFATQSGSPTVRYGVRNMQQRSENKYLRHRNQSDPAVVGTLEKTPAFESLSAVGCVPCVPVCASVHVPVSCVETSREHRPLAGLRGPGERIRLMPKAPGNLCHVVDPGPPQGPELLVRSTDYGYGIVPLQQPAIFSNLLTIFVYTTVTTFIVCGHSSLNKVTAAIPWWGDEEAQSNANTTQSTTYTDSAFAPQSFFNGTGGLFLRLRFGATTASAEKSKG